MPERIILSSEADDDDTEAPAPRVEHTPKPLEAKSLGEFFLRNEKAEKHQTFWDRLREAPEHPGILAALNERSQEKSKAEKEDDDDDDEEDKSKAEKVPTEEPVEETKPVETEPVQAEESAEIEEAAKLTAEEKKDVVKAKLAEQAPEPVAETNEVAISPPEEVAVEQFHETLAEKLEDPTKSAQESIEEAAEETIAKVEAVSDELVELAEATDEPAGPEELPLNEAVSLLTPETSEPAEEEDDDEAAAPSTPPTPPPTPPTPTPTPTPPPGGGGSGRGSTPPPYGGPTPSPFGPGGPGGPLPPYGPYTPPTPNTAPTTLDITPDDLYAAERRGQIRGVVAGGIVGYLLGRRRGRIKTENRLLPVQERLEAQVDDLHQAVATKEQQIRALAREKSEAMGDVGRATMVERLRPQSAAAPAETQVVTDQPEAVPLQPETTVVTLPPASEAIPERSPQIATEAAPIPESQPLRPVEQVPELLRNNEAPLPAKHIENVERMSNQELLRTSEKVLIDGTSLRTIYEARRITETGLKHVLAEFLSGGDIKQALDQELMVKQLTYERDPQIRDSLSAGYDSGQGGGAGGTPAAITPEQLSSADGHRNMMAAAGLPAARPPQPEPRPQQSDIPDESASSARRLEQVIVGGWVLLVAVLIIVVIVLLKHRGTL